MLSKLCFLNISNSCKHLPSINTLEVHFPEKYGSNKHALMTGIGVITLFFFVYVAVKHGETDKEGHADKVFHAFDV